MPDISERDGSRPTVLIMDNDRMALMALQSILAKALPDFELLLPVSEGSKAIQLCTATKRPPAVLLADIAMNDINGPDVVCAIRGENATTAILAITASIVVRHAQEMARAGAQGIMSKNDDVRLQVVAIAYAITRSWLVTASAALTACAMLVLLGVALRWRKRVVAQENENEQMESVLADLRYGNQLAIELHDMLSNDLTYISTIARNNLAASAEADGGD